MVDDTLGGVKANRVASHGSRELVVDGEDDFFAAFAQKPLPDVIDASSEHLAELREREQRLRARTAQGAPQAASSSKELAEAIDELPKILESKKRLEGHTELLGAVMAHVASRQLPQFIQAERQRFDEKLVAELIEAPLGDDPLPALYDRLRLLFVFALDPDDPLPDRALDAFRAALAARAEPHAAFLDRAFAALATLRAAILSRAGSARDDEAAAAAAPRDDDEPSSSSQRFSRILATAQAGATKLVDKAAKGVNSLLATKAPFAVKLLDNVFEARGPLNDAFLAVDAASDDRRLDQPPADAIIFVLGPGSYTEYHAVQAAFANSPRNVVYGASRLLNGSAFLDHLIDRAASPAD